MSRHLSESKQYKSNDINLVLNLLRPWLYYSPEASNSSFSFEGNQASKLHLQKMIAGQPFFEKSIPHYHNTLKRRAIVLSDFRLVFRSKSLEFEQVWKPVVTKLIKILYDKGFEFFVLTKKNELLLLDDKQIQQLYIATPVPNIQILSLTSVQEKIADLGLNVNQYAVLDNYSLYRSLSALLQKGFFAEELAQIQPQNKKAIEYLINKAKDPLYSAKVDIGFIVKEDNKLQDLQIIENNFKEIEQAITLAHLKKIQISCEASSIKIPQNYINFIEKAIVSLLQKASNINCHLAINFLENIDFINQCSKVSELICWGMNQVKKIDLRKHPSIKLFWLFNLIPCNLESLHLPQSVSSLSLRSVNFPLDSNTSSLKNLKIVELIDVPFKNILTSLPSNIETLDVVSHYRNCYFPHNETYLRQKKFPLLKKCIIENKGQFSLAYDADRIELPQQIAKDIELSTIIDIRERKGDQWINVLPAYIRGFVYFQSPNQSFELNPDLYKINSLEEGTYEEGDAICQIPLTPSPNFQQLPRRHQRDYIVGIVNPPQGCSLSYNPNVDQYEIFIDPEQHSSTIVLQYLLQEDSLKPHEYLEYNHFAPLVTTQSYAEDVLEDKLEQKSIVHPFARKEVNQFKEQLQSYISNSSSSDFLKNSSKLILEYIDGSCAIPDVIEPLILYCNNFKNEELSFIDPTIPPWMNLFREGKGTLCIQRTKIFENVCNLLNIPCRPILNDTHAFVELYRSEHQDWLGIDLGGHPAIVAESPLKDVDLFNKNKPVVESKTEQVQVIETKTETKLETKEQPWRRYFSPYAETNCQMEVDIYKTLFSKKDGRNWMVDIPTLEVGYGIYVGLNKYQSSLEKPIPLLYIDSYEELSEFWKSNRYKDNICEKIPGRLQKIIKENGFVIINTLRFDDAELDAIKSLNESKPFLFDQFLTSANFLFLVSNKLVDVETFFSRTMRFVWPKQIPYPQFNPKVFCKSAPETTVVESKETKNSAPTLLNLSNDSDNWYAKLIGQPAIAGLGLTWQYQGLCTAVLAGATKFETSDEPWNDRNFQAFMLRLYCEKTLYVNDKIIPLPADFQWISHPVKQLKYAKENILKPILDNVEQVFPLQSNTKYLLFPHTSLNKQNKLVQNPGWLHHIKKTGAPARLLQIDVLTESEETEICEQLKISGVSIEWLNYAHNFYKKNTSSKSHQIIVHPDPYFFINSYKNQKSTVFYEINELTPTTALIEQIKSDMAFHTLNSISTEELRFSYVLKSVAKDLIEGKWVYLYGKLPIEIYECFKTLFTDCPRLFVDGEAIQIKGKLYIITEHLNFFPRLAADIGCYLFANVNNIFEIYKHHLSIYFPDDYFADDLYRLNLLYDAAIRIPHDRVGMPEQFYLNYAILFQCLRMLRDARFASEDNPIASMYLYNYTECPEVFAYLNILGKYLFGSSEQETALDQTSFAKIPNRHDYYWRRLDCLNAKGVKVVLDHLAELTDVATPPDFHQCTPIPDEWFSEIPAILVKPKGIETIQQQMETHLELSRAVVLKGTPGTSKTYSAIKYAQEHKAELFLGNNPAQIIKFLKSKADKPTIFFDEANLRKPGALEFVRNLIKLGPTEEKGVGSTIVWEEESYILPPGAQVICTCNDDSMEERSAQRVLQIIPKIHVENIWTDENLLQNILNINPLKPELRTVKTDADVQKCYQFLLEAFHLAASLLPKNSLSLRDLQNLRERWIYKVQNNSKHLSLTTLAVVSCLHEWQHRFNNLEKIAEFKDKLNKLANKFEISVLPAAIEPVREFKTTAKFYPSHQHLQLMNLISEDMELARKDKEKTIDGAPLAKRGVVLQGPSGIGKTQLYISLLESMGYKKYGVEHSPDGKYYLHLSLSGLPHETELLLMAFNKGYAVMVDELNLNFSKKLTQKVGNAMSARTLLNFLLTGKTPEGNGPEREGFFVLSSGNIIGGGRKPLPDDIKNRLHMLYILPHTKPELIALAKQALPEFLPHAEIIEGYFAAIEEWGTEINERVFWRGIGIIKNENTLQTSVQSTQWASFWKDKVGASDSNSTFEINMNI